MRTTFSCSQQLQSMSEEQQIQFNIRWEGLKKNVQAKSHYDVRDDSRLAYLYCSNQIVGQSAEEDVAHELICIQYMCENYDYMKICEQTLRHMSNELKSKYNLKWPQIWHILTTIGCGCDAIKYGCIRTFPEFKPARKSRPWAEYSDDSDDGDDGDDGE